MFKSLIARRDVGCARSSPIIALTILFMDEKTIPLPRPGQDSDSTLKKSRYGWGEDFHYRALFEQTGECVFIIGLDLRYITANQQALSLLGYEEHELVGMPVSEVMSLGEELGHETVGSESSNLS